MMDKRQAIIRMLTQLLEDSIVLHQQGAGYYSCLPIIQRYNKLLAQARVLFPGEDGLMGTFEEQTQIDPKDPADKMKVVQGLRIEAGQLISLLGSLGGEADENDKAETS